MSGPLLVAAVLLAGIVGALARWQVSRALARRVPWAVLVVNVAGAGVAGAVTAVAPDDWRLVLVTGLCGGITTFSTFSVETVQLVLDGRVRIAAASVALNLVLGVGAAALGYLLLAG
ncbi:CrcB family protein [Galbitalea sp. SE-J8]|uniref:fluoride efflux transporter FluC n=1 Tax=Galbitalea sp. SE-J8 TaxID=3054952 RepID=UPI00259C9D47|nr:CrcB family protein [Galbitalea sp. SE-J8]MDM4762219.1 CrcB family protein [Galbitalea sp. SE-J8]